MKDNVITGVIATIIAGVSAYFQVIAIPIIMLVVVMIIDWVTGISSAYVNATMSSRTGIIGIIKKVGYVALVCVGIGIDYIIHSALTQIGVDSKVTMIFGLVVTIWLIINELISILENLAHIGVPIPKFLTKIISKLKVAVESRADTDKEDKTDE